MNDGDKEFYQGVICSLAVIKLFDHETCYREIINTMDLDDLIIVATEDDSLEWSGLVKYGYVPLCGTED